MSATEQITDLELEHPGGRLRLTVPTEVAVDELIGDFLDVAELPDSDGWAVRLPDGRPCPGEEGDLEALSSVDLEGFYSQEVDRRLSAIEAFLAFRGIARSTDYLSSRANNLNDYQYEELTAKLP